MTPEHLIAALVAMVTGLPVDQARTNAEAAITAAAEYELDPELLLGIAYVESRYDSRALSRRECEPDDPESCTRVTGLWLKATKPPKARPSWYCGPMQAGGYVPWSECQHMRDDFAYGYHVGAHELSLWLNDRRCKQHSADDQLLCALAGYNGGNQALASFKTSKYAHWVLLQRNRIIRFAERAAAKQQAPES